MKKRSEDRCTVRQVTGNNSNLANAEELLLQETYLHLVSTLEVTISGRLIFFLSYS